MYVYVLFEKDDSDDKYHEVGYTEREDNAEDWESEDPENRYYRYSPSEDLD